MEEAPKEPRRGGQEGLTAAILVLLRHMFFSRIEFIIVIPFLFVDFLVPVAYVVWPVVPLDGHFVNSMWMVPVGAIPLIGNNYYRDALYLRHL